MDELEFITHTEFWDSYYDTLCFEELTLSQLETQGYLSVLEL